MSVTGITSGGTAASPPAADPPTGGFDFAGLTSKVMTLLNEGAPLVEALEPGWAPAIAIASNLLTAAANAEPTAVALLNTIKSGEAPTPEELQAFAASYESAYDTLHDDIAAHLDTIAPAAATATAAALATTPTGVADQAAKSAGDAITNIIAEAKAKLHSFFAPKPKAEPEPEPFALESEVDPTRAATGDGAQAGGGETGSGSGSGGPAT